MSASNREALSALLDDEAQELELRRLMRACESDDESSAELRDEWYRHQLVRAALHGESPVHAPDFSKRVADALDGQELDVAPGGTGLRRAVGSFAVAASVAAAVFVGGQQLGGAAGEAGRVAPIPVGVVNTVGAVPVRASLGTSGVPTLEPASRTAYRELARQRLRLYSQEHAEHASLNTPQGMVPFARVPVIEQ
ncbi:MAG: sigma-E factor negative regulatory protein [Pseudomonadota bacterium]